MQSPATTRFWAWGAVGIIAVLVSWNIVLTTVLTQMHNKMQQREHDDMAIIVANQLAVAIAHYATLNRGRYPNRSSACWPTIIRDLGTAANLPPKTPAVFSGTVRGSGQGCSLIVYSSSANRTFQIQFAAAEGTHTVYCRDPNGLAPITPAWADGPWPGCP